MQYSPKLKRVMQEIKDILSRENIAGVVVLHEPGAVEYLVKVDPTYSCAKLQDGKLLMKATADEFGGDTTKRNRLIADTANMLHMTADAIGPIAIALLESSKFIDKHVEARHDGYSHSCHSSQNN